jgi:hypothetical protein
LHRSNEQILDRLLPESAPSSSFETVTISGIRKAAFASGVAAVRDPVVDRLLIAGMHAHFAGFAHVTRCGDGYRLEADVEDDFK